MNPTDYAFFISPLAKEDGGGFFISFPDLPGCISDGETPTDAMQNGYDAAKAWLETAKEFNDPIPQPSELSGGLMMAVSQTLRAKLLARAKREGVQMNSLLTAYLAEGLGKHEVSTLRAAA